MDGLIEQERKARSSDNCARDVTSVDGRLSRIPILPEGYSPLNWVSLLEPLTVRCHRHLHGSK